MRTVLSSRVNVPIRPFSVSLGVRAHAEFDAFLPERPFEVAGGLGLVGDKQHAGSSLGDDGGASLVVFGNSVLGGANADFVVQELFVLGAVVA